MLNKTLTPDEQRLPETQEMYKKYAARIAGLNIRISWWAAASNSSVKVVRSFSDGAAAKSPAVQPTPRDKTPDTRDARDRRSAGAPQPAVRLPRLLVDAGVIFNTSADRSRTRDGDGTSEEPRQSKDPLRTTAA